MFVSILKEPKYLRGVVYINSNLDVIYNYITVPGSNLLLINVCLLNTLTHVVKVYFY